jgi:hypothetical protein
MLIMLSSVELIVVFNLVAWDAFDRCCYLILVVKESNGCHISTRRLLA